MYSTKEGAKAQTCEMTIRRDLYFKKKVDNLKLKDETRTSEVRHRQLPLRVTDSPLNTELP